MTVQVDQNIKPGKRGLGGLGGLLGLIGGAAAVGLTGGAAAPTVGAMLGGAATGGAVGNMAGSAISPGRAAEKEQAVTTGEPGAMTRRLQSGEMQNKMNQLRESAMAATKLPDAERVQHLEPIMQAASVLSKQRGQV